jgi:DNA adenine methylase
MRYLGGKRRIAEAIAPIICSAGEIVWEPFCGGLGATVAISKRLPVVATDVHESLIALHSRGLAGVESLPDVVSEEGYRAAKTLPECALKAFIGFGCSFGAKYFGGYARSNNLKRSAPKGYAAQAKMSFARTHSALGAVSFDCVDFLRVEPFDAPGLVIYCDPPYRGRTGYRDRFEHTRFYARLSGWSAVGVPCFVSEYLAPPIEHVEVWAKEVKVSPDGGDKGRRAVERLFLIL